MYVPIPVDQTVYPGDRLQFKFGFYDILYVYAPSEDEVAQAANQAASFNVILAKYNTIQGLLGESGVIQGVVTETTTPNQIADDIRAQLANFKTVKGIQIPEIDKDDGKGEDSSIFSAPKVTTTITTAAIAVIFVVILVVFLKLS